jgi:hypothetical protein
VKAGPVIAMMEMVLTSMGGAIILNDELDGDMKLSV